MSGRVSELSERTRIPLGWLIGLASAVLTSVVTLIGAVVWATTIANTQAAQGKEIEKLATKQEAYTDHMVTISKSLAEMSVEIKNIKDSLERRKQ